MTQQPPAGWYPDPTGSAGLRWWDGMAWSTATMPVPAQPATVATVAPVATVAAPAAVATPAFATASAAPGYGYAPMMPTNAVPRTWTQQNRYALITLAVVALYVFVATSTHIVLLGVLPLAMSIRSQRSREPLAPVAIIAAVGAIVMALAVLSGH